MPDTQEGRTAVWRSPFFSLRFGGDEGARTLDLRLAKPALSQLSYVPAVRQYTLRVPNGHLPVVFINVHLFIKY